MAAADLDPTAVFCPVCGARGCPLAAIPEAHKPKRRRWFRRFRKP